MGTMGIYVIRNLNTGKCYVGGSTDVEKRLRQHQAYLSAGVHNNYKLQGAANKSGLDRLEFVQVEQVRQRTALAERELAWIKKLNSVRSGYNLTYKTECETWGPGRKKRRRVPHEIAVCAAIVVAVLLVLAA